jgi:hypothetical protein
MTQVKVGNCLSEVGIGLFLVTKMSAKVFISKLA